MPIDKDFNHNNTCDLYIINLFPILLMVYHLVYDTHVTCDSTSQNINKPTKEPSGGLKVNQCLSLYDLCCHLVSDMDKYSVL